MTLFSQTLMDGPNIHVWSAVLVKTDPTEDFCWCPSCCQPHLHLHHGLHVPDMPIAWQMCDCTPSQVRAWNSPKTNLTKGSKSQQLSVRLTWSDIGCRCELNCKSVQLRPELPSISKVWLNQPHNHSMTVCTPLQLKHLILIHSFCQSGRKFL